MLLAEIHACLLTNSMVVRCPARIHGAAFLRLTHLEGRTVYDAHYERGKPVAILRRLMLDGANHRHVAIIDYAAQSICQQILGEGAEKRVGVIQDGLT